MTLSIRSIQVALDTGAVVVISWYAEEHHTNPALLIPTAAIKTVSFVPSRKLAPQEEGAVREFVEKLMSFMSGGIMRRLD